jgi:hypothetical protein
LTERDPLMYHWYMDKGTCGTPGHEDKPEHGKTGWCQACYRRKRREAKRNGAPKQRPGKKPDPTRPHSRYNPESRHFRGGSVQCGNGHRWAEGSYNVRSDGKKVCLICIAERKGELCPAGLHERNDENINAHGACRACARENKRIHDLAYKYKLTPKQFEEKLAEQDGRCAVCHNELDFEKFHDVCIDHDHNHCPGEYTCGACVRGILCGSCNKGLGCFKDSPVILYAALGYIEQWKLFPRIMEPRPDSGRGFCRTSRQEPKGSE